MASVGQDLAIIRKQKGHSLEEIHRVTKIPMRTLLRIESDAIFDDTEENPTYVRSFIRSYAKALYIPDDKIVNALDQRQSGNYNNLLLDDYPELLEQLEKKSTAIQPEEPEEAPRVIPESNTRTITPQG
ncbi:MAG: helix-turn-helix domain-containing protein, partial [Balneolaceae bacterium]